MTTQKAKKTIPIITTSVFCIIIAAFVLLNAFITTPEIIVSERRPAAILPTRREGFNSRIFMDSTFSGQFNDFAADNFVFREQMRRVRSWMTFNVFRQSDMGGLIFHPDYGIASFVPMDERQYELTALRLTQIIQRDLDGLNLHFAIIPDKSYFTRFANMGLCPHRGAEIIGADLPSGVNMIDLTDTLTVDDFYRTDLHWCQTRLWGVMDRLSQEIGFANPAPTPIIDVGYWHGVYYQQLAMPMPQEPMRVHQVEGVTAWYWNHANNTFARGPIYDKTDPRHGFPSIDPYNIFLRGPQTLIRLETGNNTGRNLYLFRDSFGSSIAPLLSLSESYDNIWLIDLRSAFTSEMAELIGFTAGSDVLFLYSSLILNNHDLFRIGQ
ncbi:MAG: hypothetical protein FWB93_06130 [Oscillospiraceae bacterium]|nr:hypothetical protein [Oscillospiraceae bacterium]